MHVGAFVLEHTGMSTNDNSPKILVVFVSVICSRKNVSKDRAVTSRFPLNGTCNTTLPLCWAIF